MSKSKIVVSLALDPDVVADLDRVTRATGQSRSSVANLVLRAVSTGKTADVMDAARVFAAGAAETRKAKQKGGTGGAEVALG